MASKAKNNVSCTLSAAITSSGATTCTLQSGEGANFSDCNGTDYCYATIESAAGTTREIVKVTNRSGDQLTITRGQDNSTATTFAIGDKVERRWNVAAVYDYIIDAITSALATLLATVNTWSVKQIFSATVKLQQVLEKFYYSISGLGGTVSFNVLDQAVFFMDGAATANWTPNFRGDGSNTLNSVMAVGESITVTIMATQGATPYYPSAHQIDGSAVTPKWLGGAAPTAGDASSINVYTYTITKIGATPQYTVLASKSKYA